MIEESSARRELAFALLKIFPPIVQESLAQSETFTRTFDFNTRGKISFSSSNISFDHTEFFDCVRQLYNKESDKVSLRSEGGQAFEFELRVRNGETFLHAESGETTAELPSFWFLSPDRECRVKTLKDVFSDKNISGKSYQKWFSKMAVAPLSDADIDAFLSDARNNTLDAATAIRTAVASGSSLISTLVPDRSDYYQQLVGDDGDTKTLNEYLTGSFKQHISELFEWDKYVGLSQALLICPQGTLSRAINLDSFDQSLVLSFYEWLSVAGDRFSQVAGVEIGFGILSKYPSIEPYLLKIISDILDDKDDDEDGRLKLSSSIFVFVDGELSRLGIMRDWPPFLRRIASLAQASLIERELIGVGVASGKFADWAVSGRGNTFYMQSLADLRIEPRWLPDFADARQIKAELISRVANDAALYKEHEFTPALKKLLFSEDDDGIRQQLKFPFSFFPGPLEGGIASPNPLPSDLVAELQRPKDVGILKGKFFAGIVNSALVFDIKPEHATLVMEALRNANHQLSLNDEPHLTFHLLSGLAIIAAVTRAPDLAQDVKLLANVLQRRESTKVEPENLLRVAMIASASCVTLPDWCKSVGEWFYEISCGEISAQDAKNIRNHLHSLCRIVPQLWTTCGKADSALASQARG